MKSSSALSAISFTTSNIWGLTLLYLEAVVQRCSVKKMFLKNSQDSPGNHLHLRPATLLKKILWHRCFPENFVKFLITTFLENTSRRLLLHFLKWTVKSSQGLFLLDKASFLKLPSWKSLKAAIYLRNCFCFKTKNLCFKLDFLH